jgi:hypothetical protein
VDWSGLSPAGIHTVAVALWINIPNGWANIKDSACKLNLRPSFSENDIMLSYVPAFLPWFQLRLGWKTEAWFQVSVKAIHVGGLA